MRNRLLFILSIALIGLTSACQTLRHSLNSSSELPVNESEERVNLLGKPVETKPEDSSRNETPVSKPAQTESTKREKAVKQHKAQPAKSNKVEREKPVKQRKPKASKSDRKTRRGKLAAQQAEPAKTPDKNQPSSGLLFSESQGLGLASKEIETVIRAAETFLGVPYRWGGMSRAGVDCSGLMVLAFQAVGLTIPRVSGDQYAKGKPIKKADIRPGDLLFFSSGRPGVIGHTALVVAVKGGSIKFIHATSGYGVRHDYLESEHWSKLYIAASRYL